MTEAFRRDYRMNTFAIHLFIDAFPSGWMKTIMDVDRQPKPAYFAYRECLEPLFIHFRTDRYRFFSDEQIPLELWICNDLSDAPAGYSAAYRMIREGKVIQSGKTSAAIPSCSSLCLGTVRFKAPNVSAREELKIQTVLLNSEDKTVSSSEKAITVFPEQSVSAKGVRVYGSPKGKAHRLVNGLGLTISRGRNPGPEDVLITDNPDDFERNREEIEKAVTSGAVCLLLPFPPGAYRIAGDTVTITECGMKPVHFVSRKTGHPAVDKFNPDDFKFWYDETAGYVTPLLEASFEASGWTEVLSSGNGGWQGSWKKTLAVAEKRFGMGKFILCQLKVSNRIRTEPCAKILLKILLGL
jgi:hypothetical protein